MQFDLNVKPRKSWSFEYSCVPEQKLSTFNVTIPKANSSKRLLHAMKYRKSCFENEVTHLHNFAYCILVFPLWDHRNPAQEFHKCACVVESPPHQVNDRFSSTCSTVPTAHNRKL